MRKLMKGLVAGFLVVGLLAVAAPAKAQGLGDPLSLAASGVLIPFFGTGNDSSILEVASPVGSNPLIHFIFYDAACNRTESFPWAQTENDIDLFLAASNTVPTPPTITVNKNGLIAIATDDGGGFNLVPIPTTGNTPQGSPIHTRVYWINAGSPSRHRVLEPITLDNAEDPFNTWNPLRSAATFFAPRETATGFKTTLWLICPRDTIQRNSLSATDDSAFAIGRGFPVINSAGGLQLFTTPGGFSSSYGFGSLAARVYDVDEVFLRDWRTDCNCLVQKDLSGATAVSTVYSTADTFTELETDGTNNKFFTGYKAMTFQPAPQVDLFGRLSNANWRSVRNQGGAGVFFNLR